MHNSCGLRHEEIQYRRFQAPGHEGKGVGYGAPNAFADCMAIDQNPIGKSARSNPISYVGAFDEIRKLFAKSTHSKRMGLSVSDFSFNSGSGRCQTCMGTGFEHVEMQFLSDVYLRCGDCDGTRFSKRIRSVKLNLKKEKNVNIHDVLCSTPKIDLNL